jgi:hypothetical protein
MTPEHLIFHCPQCNAKDRVIKLYAEVYTSGIFFYKSAHGDGVDYCHSGITEDVTGDTINGIEVPELPDDLFYCDECKFTFRYEDIHQGLRRCFRSKEEPKPKPVLDRTLTPENLNRYLQVVDDLKKQILYFKGDDAWAWSDKYAAFHGPFKSYWDCVLDIVEPYFSEESEN